MTTTTDSKKEIPDSPVIDLIRNTVRQQEPDAEIILYGSRARGDARPDSDWDVVILVDSPNFNYKERGNITYKLWFEGMEHNIDIDAFAYSKKQWDNFPPSIYKYNVVNEGVRI